MTVATPFFGIACAAFCIWLAARIFNRRERRAKWTLATVTGLPLLYVAGFGPACWLSRRFVDKSLAVEIVELFYQPVLRAAVGESWAAGDVLSWYAELGAAPRWHVEGLCFSNDAIWTPR